MHCCGVRWGEAVLNVAGETEAQISQVSTNALSSEDSHL